MFGTLYENKGCVKTSWGVNNSVTFFFFLSKDQEERNERREQEPLLGCSAENVTIRMDTGQRSTAITSNNGLNKLKGGCAQALCLILWAFAISVHSVGGFIVEKIYY